MYNINEFSEEEILSNIAGQKVHTALAEIITRLFVKEDGPLLIAIGGPGGTGKSSFSRKLAQELQDSAILRLDNYKMSRSFRKERGIFGPHPDANDMELISEHLAMIKSAVSIDMPVYNSTTGCADSFQHYCPVRHNIIDGEVSSYPEFRQFTDFSVFIDADLETQLNTRLTRDIQKRGYSRQKAMDTFLGSNLNEFTEYGAVTKNDADIVLFCEKDYSLMINSISKNILNKLSLGY